MEPNETETPVTKDAGAPATEASSSDATPEQSDAPGRSERDTAAGE